VNFQRSSFAAALLGVFFVFRGILPAGEPPAGFKALLGSSLEGWFTIPGDSKDWSIDGEGNLACRGGKSYLWSEEEYGDFVLDLEVNLSEGCNSGVFIRTDPKNPIQGGFEIQVIDSAGKEEMEKDDFGAFYDAVAPLVNAAKPAGAWNRMVIRWEGAKLTVLLNGKKVQELSVDDWTAAHYNPDGSWNKFRTALKDLPRKGHIGFQNHGHDVWYRNVFIRALD